MEQLSGLDAAFVYAETAGAAHVTFLAIYDPSTAENKTVTFDDVVTHVGSRLGADRLFRSVLARVPLDLDHPYWVRDPDFDLSRHLHHLTLPSPGGWQQLCEQVSRLHEQRMDLHRPPWDGYFIDGLGHIRGVPDGAFALCFKMHHSAVDGVTGLGIATALHDLSVDTAPPPADDWTPERRPSSLNLLARTAVTYVRRPARFVATARHSLPLLSGISASVLRALPIGHRAERGILTGAPHTRFNQPTDSRRNFDARSFDLSAVAAARKRVAGATVNDVVLAGIGGALRRYLLDKGELPDSSLVTFIAIAEHTDPDHEHGANQIAVARVPLGTDIADPIARLRAVHESSAGSKAFTEAVGPHAAVEYAEFLPGTLVVGMIRLMMAMHLGKYYPSARFGNTYVTTMRGPDFPIYLLGAKMIAGYGLSPFTQGNGLMHSVVSYCGRVLVSINGCPAVLPDIEHYADCVDAAFAELLGTRTPEPSVS
ncbi:wax ester/triacylglycerol synthase family O-acyltransferase [Mycolicibacterium sp. ND9-15]|uniref:wax ester/triacylglycerol synthase family O-acyltransferase n=1 Tax=Mycolicibacterium sp. ND9-15 TaxID=3042320 RepID=UPI002DDBF456|nr:wax ester/triacylglycerol synthase family O-acyltransferase [Mycolicibacterium sp. ND9-15]WSE57788.1 wax ester/triacylglycerol synthase family O-acyltransferase [Mycolicibacterium sp. ND9-15]